VSLLTEQHMLRALALRGQASKVVFEKEESRQFLRLKKCESELQREGEG
jgi:hypothetical protein